MATEHAAIFGAAAAARAAASAESSGLRRLWADMRIFYIALFASFVGLSCTIKLAGWQWRVGMLKNLTLIILLLAT